MLKELDWPKLMGNKSAVYEWGVGTYLSTWSLPGGA